MDIQNDARVRTRAFDWLSQQVEEHGDVLPFQLLRDGFSLDGIRVPLLGPQGIFKPRVLSDAPLSITTAPNGPYNDVFGEDGLLRYRYRGNDPQHRDNQALRTAMVHRLPLVYLHGISTGKYLTLWPVFVVGDDPSRLTFSVALDDSHAILLQEQGTASAAFGPEDDRRRYITGSVRIRLHQRTFRERVLAAYQRRCAFCRFRHEEMLDAAHIVPDKDPEGEPVIPNGLSLCSLHHAAFDRNFLGLRPDYTIEVRPDILVENDGPTLLHGIQALHDSRIFLPRETSNRPGLQFVELRYSKFRLWH
jgi:putative restriction endonuclease